jgi:2-polyprenyl-3-methyl-5-hydroxy-6-metoxy-1,4-benzoquinol methylase
MNSNFWDEKYTEKPDFYGEIPNDYLTESIDKLSKGLTLSLGEGEGRNALFLAENGFEVDALDMSEVALLNLYAKAKSRNLNVNTMVLDLKEFDPTENSYDSIISIWCHLPPELRVQVHHNCIKALKPGGTILIEAYTPEQLEYKTGGPPVAEMMFSKEILQEDFSQLECIECTEKIRMIQEGEGHSGQSAVVRGIWRKK